MTSYLTGCKDEIRSHKPNTLKTRKHWSLKYKTLVSITVKQELSVAVRKKQGAGQVTQGGVFWEATPGHCDSHRAFRCLWAKHSAASGLRSGWSTQFTVFPKCLESSSVYLFPFQIVTEARGRCHQKKKNVCIYKIHIFIYKYILYLNNWIFNKYINNLNTYICLYKLYMYPPSPHHPAPVEQPHHQQLP